MLLSLAERVLNEQIRASTAARERLAALDGKRFAVAVRGTALRIVLDNAGGALTLSRSADDCDVELTASAFELLKLARSASLTDLRNVDASLNGNVDVAEGFADLMRLAVPEFEDLIADWIGDMPAHAVGEAGRRVGRFVERAGRAFEQNAAEYLQEESPTLVPPPLARRFGNEVDRLRDDVDRAERRIENLERRLGKRDGKQFGQQDGKRDR
jgi:ubiquinone biosynthesis protein UbiJ